MSGLSFVLLAVVAVMSFGAQPKPPGKAGKVVNVEIIVNTIDAHATLCKSGKVLPTTVLVAGRAVRHCVGGVLLDHDVDETKNPAAFKQTLVHVRIDPVARLADLERHLVLLNHFVGEVEHRARRHFVRELHRHLFQKWVCRSAHQHRCMPPHLHEPERRVREPAN